MKNALPRVLLAVGLFAAFGAGSIGGEEVDPLLGLPPVPIPENNPMTADKIELGEILYVKFALAKGGRLAERALTRECINLAHGELPLAQDFEHRLTDNAGSADNGYIYGL